VTDPSLAKLLSEQRDTLERLQWGAVADSVRVLSEAASMLSETAERLQETSRSESPWLTHEQAAERLRTTPDGLYKMAGVPRHKIAGKWRYHRDELDRWGLGR
jgi:hypothetical protein